MSAYPDVRCRRPAMRYHGGKWNLAPWIVSHFPEHRTYTEVFGGAASVLLRKPRSYAEVYNDLDGEVVNVFRVFRDHGQELLVKLWATPFARDEFIESYFADQCPIEQARRTIARSFMGFGSASVTNMRHATTRFVKPTTGFRANSTRSGSTPAHDWANYSEAAEALIERFRGVIIENKDAASVLAQHDHADALHYVDPPYVKSSLDAGADYRFEMDDAQHCDLATTLKSLTGKVVVSGYHTDLYERLYKGWHRTERAALADGAAKRTEVLWMNFTPGGQLI